MCSADEHPAGRPPRLFVRGGGIPEASREGLPIRGMKSASGRKAHMHAPKMIVRLCGMLRQGDAPVVMLLEDEVLVGLLASDVLPDAAYEEPSPELLVPTLSPPKAHALHQGDSP